MTKENISLSGFLTEFDKSATQMVIFFPLHKKNVMAKNNKTTSAILSGTYERSILT